MGADGGGGGSSNDREEWRGEERVRRGAKGWSLLRLKGRTDGVMKGAAQRGGKHKSILQHMGRENLPF